MTYASQIYRQICEHVWHCSSNVPCFGHDCMACPPEGNTAAIHPSVITAATYATTGLPKRDSRSSCNDRGCTSMAGSHAGNLVYAVSNINWSRTFLSTNTYSRHSKAQQTSRTQETMHTAAAACISNICCQLTVQHHCCQLHRASPQTQLLCSTVLVHL
jgi:hypothetical protein